MWSAAAPDFGIPRIAMRSRYRIPRFSYLLEKAIRLEIASARRHPRCGHCGLRRQGNAGSDPARRGGERKGMLNPRPAARCLAASSWQEARARPAAPVALPPPPSQPKHRDGQSCYRPDVGAAICLSSLNDRNINPAALFQHRAGVDAQPLTPCPVLRFGGGGPAVGGLHGAVCCRQPKATQSPCPPHVLWRNRTARATDPVLQLIS